MPELKSAHGRRIAIPRVMAIVNATPDSFSDGGLVPSMSGAQLRAHLQGLVEAGAGVLDLGAESTRPGHEHVDAETEWRRLEPVLAQATRTGAWISIDTTKTSVAKRALDAGADFVNDVAGLTGPGMTDLVAAVGCSAIIMRHASLQPPVVASAQTELQALTDRAKAAGVQDAQILWDPGLGFGDPPGADVDANLALLDADWPYPWVIGASRKRFVGTLMGGVPASMRVQGSVDLALRAVRRGAAMVRVHDVAETTTALRLAGLA